MDPVIMWGMVCNIISSQISLRYLSGCRSVDRISKRKMDFHSFSFVKRGVFIAILYIHCVPKGVHNWQIRAIVLFLKPTSD